jgi:plastocyanin
MGINLPMGLVRFYALAGGTAGALAVMSCHGPTAPDHSVPGASNTITAIGSSACYIQASTGATICNFYFTPTPDTIVAGTMLYFTYGDVEHQVVWDTPGSPPNGEPAENVTLPIGTAQPGVYHYHCAIHGYEQGVLVVVKP